MHYLALASDYDGTLAHDGLVDDDTIQALERLVNSGRKLILVTGRELPDLEAIFPRLDLCERVVAENGALLYHPAAKEKRALAEHPSPEFLAALRKRGIVNMSVGEVIVATWRPYEVQVLEAIQELGLELQIIFNKDAVMILPPGVNKKSGLCLALAELGLSPHNVVGVGDAENDHAFLESCGFPAAVENAIPSLKAKAVLVTAGARGEGVRELIDGLLKNDLADAEAARTDNRIGLGSIGSDTISMPAYGRTVLICGQSGSGKSTFVVGFLERLLEKKYQIALVDPEGDYENLAGFRTLGTEQHQPSNAEISRALEGAGTDIILNLVAVAATDRAQCFSSLIATIQENRLRTGRPNWIVVDEAHHVFPSEWGSAAAELNNEFTNVVLVSVHPEHVSPDVLKKVNTVMVVGRQPRVSLEEFGRVIGKTPPPSAASDLERGQTLIWFVDQDRIYTPVQAKPSRIQHARHKRKYAEGQLEDERVFHFRGPDNKMDLRAHNLSTFVELAKGLDADTWQFHLGRADYSTWARNAIKDSDLADDISGVEQDNALSDEDSRARIIAIIQERYTAPA